MINIFDLKNSATTLKNVVNKIDNKEGSWVKYYKQQYKQPAVI